MAPRYCETCGKELSILPYICKYCSKNFCVEHRLPEKHACENIKKVSENARVIHAEDLVREIMEFEKAKTKEIRKNPLERIKKKFRIKRTKRKS